MPVSSLESIPNPIPRKTAAFEAVGNPGPASTAQAPPSSKASRASSGAIRAVVASPTPEEPRPVLPRVATAPMLAAVIAPVAESVPPIPDAHAAPVALQQVPVAPPPPPMSAREETKSRRGRDVATTPPPPALGQALSFAPLWPEADRESARQAEAALAAGDGAGALLVCDVLVTRLLASAAGLTGNAEAPRDPGLVVLLLGLDGRRYLAFRAAVRSARAHERVLTVDGLEAYAFTLEVRRALASIGW